MSRFFSKRFSSLEAYVPGEQPQDMQYIKLNTNESPYPPPQAVIDCLNADEGEKLRLYSDPECSRLRKKIAKHFGTDSRRVFVGNGSDEVLGFFFMGFCDSTHPVAFPDITYGFYKVFADLYALERKIIPLDDNLSVNPDDYIGLGMNVVIANPNAPTGMCISLTDIERIAESNPGNVVLIDEAYVDFGGESAVALTERYDNLLVVQTFSKSRSMAGSRLGFAIGNEALIADMETLRYSTNPYNVNRITLKCGEIAMESGDYFAENCRLIAETRDNTAKRLAEMGFTLTDSKANFLFTAHPDYSGEMLYLELKRRGILVRHFSAPRISEYLRITVGTPADMDSLCEALEDIMKNGIK